VWRREALAILRNIAQGSRLRERAYEAIKEAILTLELAPGQPVNEAELAAQLNVSRTPIRDALLQLQSEGFVIIQPFRGAFVSELTAQDIIEIFALREMLEVPAARHAAQNWTPDDIAAAEALLQQMQAAAEQNDVRGYALLSDQFHSMVVQKLNNRRVMQVLENLHDHLMRLRNMALLVTQSKEFIDDYRALIDAIQSESAPAAEKAMRTHLRRILRTLVADAALT